ncbi:MAG: N-carbamoylputrescine amidase, partial [Bacilli bacterium]|nr:N-carbamoylputrescine amidase [Bacilli bacterium]
MKIKVAITQFSMPDNYKKCIEKADNFIKTASKNGVDLLLLPELFEGYYFCQIENYDFFSKAEEAKDSKTLKHFQEMAKEYKIVLPISFFEKSGNCYFNSLAMIDKDGSIVDI